MKTLRLILGDQLNHHHSWYNEVNNDHIYVMMEMGQELTYITHHIQKVVAFFLAMREFAKHLKSEGHQVIYLKLDDPKNSQNLTENLQRLIKENSIEHFEYQLPDEYRLDQQLSTLCEQLEISVEAADTEHFLTTRTELADFFKGKKTLLMESFYRMMRKKHEVLMEGSQPIGGKWNYDHENRKKAPKGTYFPNPKSFNKNVVEITDLLQKEGIKTIGHIDPKHFIWPVSRAESLNLLDFFVSDCLPFFGKYQDAMTTEGWSLFHSRLSFAINAKLLHPMEVIRKVEQHGQANQERFPLAAVEGFIRQILGWREYMRGVYWMHMPDYAQKNFFDHQRPLPQWFWTGKTKMKCLSHAIEQSLNYAYAHHIQRLMVTGNFALLAGIHPDEVDQWYLGIYIDAIEWVEITNTRGMSQFADGGIIASKPYVSSGNYINKMSDYCGQCAYLVKDKTGENACPFNLLYWHFLDRHRDRFGQNPRMGNIYRTWDRMAEDRRDTILRDAEAFLSRLDAGEIV